MAAYQLTSGKAILRVADGATIPDDPANGDYAAYLGWIAAGNAPDPAPVIAPPSAIPIAAFWARFTVAEQNAIMAAATPTPSIATALTFASVMGQVNLLSGPIATTWMAGLVSAGIITPARSTAILKP